MDPLDGATSEKSQAREDRLLTVLYVVVCLGFLALGIVQLLCGSVPVEDIG